jgi:hypothetical protein
VSPDLAGDDRTVAKAQRARVNYRLMILRFKLKRTHLFTTQATALRQVSAAILSELPRLEQVKTFVLLCLARSHSPGGG